MTAHEQQHRTILQTIARRAMLDRGLLPDFSSQALAELDRLAIPALKAGGALRDLRDRPWCSIDNDDSLDLDQLTMGEALPAKRMRIWVAVADVDALVKKGGALDEHARSNTTTVYTAAEIFPMLPEKLSTGLTSLNYNEERLVIVMEMTIAAGGALESADLYRAWVRNHAKLAYHSLAAWLDGTGAQPEAVSLVPGLADILRLQDEAGWRMKNYRYQQGALNLETIEARPVFIGDRLNNLEIVKKNRAREMIGNFMIAANGVTARFLASKHYPAIRRVVLAPRRWDRIVEIASEHGTTLPGEPDSKALEDFLTHAQAADPLRFPDLSLSIVKLIGPGEYVAQLDGDLPAGHFGLAVKDYAHSTAPNRRFTDLVTHRLLKAALAGSAYPYTMQELQDLASHCTQQEDAANKVERQVTKSAAALLLKERIGERFDALVTGAAPKGTWVRLLSFPVEGRLAAGYAGVDVGQRLRVELVLVDVEKGFIDFKKVR